MKAGDLVPELSHARRLGGVGGLVSPPPFNLLILSTQKIRGLHTFHPENSLTLIFLQKIFRSSCGRKWANIIKRTLSVFFAFVEAFLWKILGLKLRGITMLRFGIIFFDLLMGDLQTFHFYDFGISGRVPEPPNQYYLSSERPGHFNKSKKKPNHFWESCF